MATVHLFFEFLVLGSCWSVTCAQFTLQSLNSCAQFTLQSLNLVRAVCAWKLERLDQIVDIPVPQSEEEIAEVKQLYHKNAFSNTQLLALVTSAASAVSYTAPEDVW